MPNGIGAINVREMVEASLLKEQRSLTRLERAKAHEKTHIDTYTNLSALIQTFSSQMTALNTALITANQVSSSNSSQATASITPAMPDVTNIVAPGSHSLSITQTATSNVIASVATWPDSNITTMGAAETLTFTQGSTVITVPVSATDTLQTVCNNINSATGNTSIKATPVSVAPNIYKLVLTSTALGSANQIVVSGDTNNTFQLTDIRVPAQDAIFSFDNLNITRSTNAVSDVLSGLTLNLLAPTSSPITITIEADPLQNQNITTAVQNFLTSYNQILATIDKSQADRDTKDEALPYIKNLLQDAMASTFNVSGQFKLLSDIGIVHGPTVQQKIIRTVLDENGREVKKEIPYSLTGQLQLSTDQFMPTLTDAISTSITDLQNFFTDPTNGFFALLQNNTLQSITEPDPEGAIYSRTQTFNDKLRFIDQKISSEQSRLATVQDTLYTKFSKLNTLLSKFDRTQHFLETQLSSLKMYERG